MLDTLKNDLKTAMRNKEKIRRDTIRLLISELQKEKIKQRADLSAEACLKVLTREVKKRREAVTAYRKGDRPELADKEEAEMAVLGGYLPKSLGEDEVKALIQSAIEAVKPQSQRDMGKVMGKIMPAIRGRFDGKAASTMVRQAMASFFAG